MPKRIQPVERLPIPPELETTAIGHCCEAWSRAFEEAVAEGRGEISRRMRANRAYRIAMPPLTCAENVPAFVACVAHGLVMGTIVDTIATRLIHAAQVVSRACKSASREPSSRPQAPSQTTSSAPETISPDQP